MTKKRLGLITAVSLAVALMLVFAAAGCGESDNGTAQPEEPKLSGTLNLSGSTTVLPLAQEAADMFMDENPSVTVNVQGGGSSVGISNVAESVVDIGNASRGLKDEEKSLGLVDHEIALDVIVVIVHSDVPLEGLTADQVFDIFTGKVTNWKDVGGPDQAINVVVRDEASGTREMFDEKALRKEAPMAGAIECNSNGIVRQTVSSTPFSVGYISLGYLDSSVKALKYDGVEGSKVTAVDKSYPLSRYLHMFTRGEATGLAGAFLDLVLSDGFQNDVVSQEYIPMTEI
ncbi:MAG: phosphate ABC transporter substrate-binding protein [Actinomycetota bacterium]|nr:phosphate ABC transporter substrate-binding protein [Actinomycetota bacterium]MDD5667722.1 phosphate ABC transporter substrate-binding protein [Actinomycetota bacterium]